MSKKIANYYLIEIIGKGSFASVYKARNDKNNQFYAVKMISINRLSEGSMTNIETESELMRKLDHPNILRLFETKKSSNNYYMIFEYCSNGDLECFLRKYYYDEELKRIKLNENLVKGIVFEIIEAFKFLQSHQIVHRDLKLTNILVSNNFEIKIADFGFARHIEMNTLMQTYCGTPLTMAPEIIEKSKYDSKCDIWSLGVVIYQLLFDKYPFIPKDYNIKSMLKEIQNKGINFPPEIQISDQAKNLLNKMLVFNFKERIDFQNLFNDDWIKSEIENCKISFNEVYKLRHRRTTIFEDVIESESEGETFKNESNVIVLQQISASKTKVYQILFREYEKIAKNLFDNISNCDIAFTNIDIELKESTYYLFHDNLLNVKNFFCSKLKIDINDSRVYLGNIQEFVRNTRKYKEIVPNLKSHFSMLEKCYNDLFGKRDSNGTFCDSEIFRLLNIFCNEIMDRVENQELSIFDKMKDQLIPRLIETLENKKVIEYTFTIKPHEISDFEKVDQIRLFEEAKINEDSKIEDKIKVNWSVTYEDERDEQELEKIKVVKDRINKKIEFSV